MSMLQPAWGEMGSTDPVPLPWAQIELPDAWPDALDLRRPRDLWRFLTKVLLRRLSRVRLPPYLPLNVTSTTLQASATTGAITLTASAVTGINGGDGFKTTDVGRLVRYKNATWGWAIITGWTS